MSAPQRRFEPAVIQKLFVAPYRFQFFQAMRMIQVWFVRNGVAPTRGLSDFVRFANRTALGFAASEIHGIRFVATGLDDAAASAPDLQDALRSGAMKYIVLTPSFMGFLGSSGSLPVHYTEELATHQNEQRDEGPRAFLDAFSTRSLALFYLAWNKYKLAFQHEQNQRDRFLPLLRALAGVGFHALHDRLDESDRYGVRDESIGFFAGALGMQQTSALHLQHILKDYFAVPVEVLQFMGRWYVVPAAHQTRLGGQNAALGMALVGERVWQRDLRIRLRIGPLTRAQFEHFLPGAQGALALTRMLGLFAGPCLEYEVQLLLRRDEVEGVVLREPGFGTGGRLGWDAFVVTQPQSEDRADILYEVMPH